MGYLNILLQKWSNFRPSKDPICGHQKVKLKWNGEKFTENGKLNKLRDQDVRSVHEEGEIMAEEENSEPAARFFSEVLKSD